MFNMHPSPCQFTKFSLLSIQKVDFIVLLTRGKWSHPRKLLENPWNFVQNIVAIPVVADPRVGLGDIPHLSFIQTAGGGGGGLPLNKEHS